MGFQTDQDIFSLIEQELYRQQHQIELIASENFVSQDILRAQGSILTNKYAEGYPGKRYYGGCVYVDEIEKIAIKRVCELFGCHYANVQPHSGSQANGAVFLSLLSPGDCFLGMSLNSGGHLTHGAKVSMSGKWFRAIGYDVDSTTHLIDYDRLEALALEHSPRLIIAGGSSYSRLIDFKRFRSIADQVGAYLMVDMAHFSGLVAAGLYPSPFPYADVVTSTTHKTLRGPRGGLILTDRDDMIKRINSAIFPGTQGGPLMHVIAAKAICFREAATQKFKTYAKNIIDNIKAMEETFNRLNIPLISKGSDTHLLMLDLSPFGLTGKTVCAFLETIGITCNKNSIPGDLLPPSQTSGIRIGTAACTTRGFDARAFQEVAQMICEAITILATLLQERGPSVLSNETWWREMMVGNIPMIQLQDDFHHRARNLCEQFPLYLGLNSSSLAEAMTSKKEIL